jgi:hypothetical protein
MADIGRPGRWWYEPEDDPLALPIPDVEPAAVPTPEPAPVPA